MWEKRKKEDTEFLRLRQKTLVVEGRAWRKEAENFLPACVQVQ